MSRSASDAKHHKSAPPAPSVKQSTAQPTPAQSVPYAARHPRQPGRIVRSQGVAQVPPSAWTPAQAQFATRLNRIARYLRIHYVPLEAAGLSRREVTRQLRAAGVQISLSTVDRMMREGARGILEADPSISRLLALLYYLDLSLADMEAYMLGQTDASDDPLRAQAEDLRVTFLRLDEDHRQLLLSHAQTLADHQETRFAEAQRIARRAQMEAAADADLAATTGHGREQHAAADE